VTEGSIKVIPPKYPGALIFAITGLDFETELVGGSSELGLQISILGMCVLLIDDVKSAVPHQKVGALPAFEFWRVSFEILAS
jgi:hypothetical protein